MSYIRRFADSFSALGLILGLAFFSISLTPSLLPRTFIFQGILSGVVFSAGYGIGKAGYWIWKFMELRDVAGRLAKTMLW